MTPIFDYLESHAEGARSIKLVLPQPVPLTALSLDTLAEIPPDGSQYLEACAPGRTVVRGN